MRATIAAPLALACGIAAAQAPSVYRCGNSYGSQPCAGARAIATEVPQPTDAERKQAAAAAQRDARLADSLEKDRLKQEARPAQLYVPPPKFEPAPQPHKGPEKAATRKLDVFTASAPGSQKKDKDKKARPKSAAEKAETAGAGQWAGAAKR